MHPCAPLMFSIHPSKPDPTPQHRSQSKYNSPGATGGRHNNKNVGIIVSDLIHGEGCTRRRRWGHFCVRLTINSNTISTNVVAQRFTPPNRARRCTAGADRRLEYRSSAARCVRLAGSRAIKQLVTFRLLSYSAQNSVYSSIYRTQQQQAGPRGSR